MNLKSISLSVLLLMYLNYFRAATYHSDTIDVLHYKIDIGVYRFNTAEISGSTTLKIVPKINQTNRFCLDLLKFTIDSVKWNGQNYTNFSYNDTLLIFTPQQLLNQSDTFDVEIFYHGKPKKDPSNWGGFYFTSDYAFTLGVGMASDPHVVGRYWYPCIDDFVDRAAYDFYITVKSEHKAICNGLLQEVINAPENRKTYHWKMTDEIPTYLACLAVGNYVVCRDTFNGIQRNIPIEIWTSPADSLSGVTAFSGLKNILTAFEESFGPYRWQKVGYVAVPFDGGAMEHASLITFPRAYLNASQNSQILIAHELSHHWFGNLITCASEQEMWINEGWASFCEVVFLEKIYGLQTAFNHKKSVHKTALTKAHVDDNGYWSLAGMPHQYTYGTHSYDKGSDVVTSLRYFLGDSLFFTGITQTLQHFAFQPVTSIQLRDYLETVTGVDLHGFFNALVFSPGFYHFCIDSFKVENINNQFVTKLFIKQKKRHTTGLAYNLKTEAAFLAENGRLFRHKIAVGGQTCTAEVTVPFNPVAVFFDPEQNFSDAILDDYRQITTAGVYDFYNASFTLYANTLPDTCNVYAAFNYVQPDSFITHVNSLSVTDYAWWTISGNFPQGFSGKGKFMYNSRINSGPVVTTDSLILLYRKNAGENWRRIQATKSGNYISGSFTTTNFIEPGQYAIGLYDYHASVEKKTDHGSLQISPNPAGEYFKIDFGAEKPEKIAILDTSGKTIFLYEITEYHNNICFNTSSFQRGIYFIVMKFSNQLIYKKLIII